MIDKTPNLFIIGVAKCGTTSLYNYLSEHPDIYAPKLKEPRYFTRESLKNLKINKNKYKNMVNGLKEYLALYEKVTTEKYLVDGSVYTHYFEQSLINLINMSPNCKVIMMVRNPVDRFISHYKMSITMGDTKLSLDDFILKPIDGMGVDSLNLGCYADSILKVYKIIGENNVHIIFYDDIVDDVDKTLIKVYEFLKIDTILPSNRYETFYRRNQIAKNIPLKNFYYNNKTLKKLKKVMKNFKLINLKKVIKKLLWKDPIVKKENLKFLYNYYEKEIIKLEKLTGRDLKEWRMND